MDKHTQQGKKYTLQLLQSHMYPQHTGSSSLSPSKGTYNLHYNRCRKKRHQRNSSQYRKKYTLQILKSHMYPHHTGSSSMMPGKSTYNLRYMACRKKRHYRWNIYPFGRLS